MQAKVAMARDGALVSPGVGWFRWSVGRGDALEAGRRLGVLAVLGRRVPVLVPTGVHGVVAEEVPAGRVAVQYGQALVVVGQPTSGEASTKVRAGEVAASGYAVKAPIDGIFYGRPSPDAPPYVTVGDTLAAGDVIGLVEVMKTFNPIHYGGAGAPAKAKVLAVEARDQQEVAAGSVLVVVEAID